MIVFCKLLMVFFVWFSLGPGLPDSAPFYVSKRYQENLEQHKRTGTGEVAFFAIAIPKRTDTTLQINAYRRIEANLRIDADYFSTEDYQWDEAHQYFTSTCRRQPSGGLFRHQHTEGQHRIHFSSQKDTIYLRRCGLIRTENILILADQKSYLND